MNKLGIDTINEERFTVEVIDDTAGLLIKIVGDIDMSDPSGILDPLFSSVHNGAVAESMEEIKVDFTALNFLNSSGIKAIAKWIMKLAVLSPDQKYKIRLLHNKSITWQATSLPTLTFLVPGTVEIE